jgi:Flp pilus assembly protein TadG
MGKESLVIGLVFGVIGLGTGLYAKSQVSDIAAKLDPVKKQVATLNTLLSQYEKEWGALQDKYNSYMNGGTIDWTDVATEKAALLSLENQIDAQVIVVMGVING